MDEIKLKEIIEVTGQIRLLSGLHIGAASEGVKIGGADMTVVRNPATFEPYIPGSSLKGKMRSLLEQSVGCGEAPLKWVDVLKDSNKKLIVQLFGSSGSDTCNQITRIVVSDATLSEESREHLRNGTQLTEIKAENVINRITGTAKDPRFMERVIAGAVFDFSIKVKVFNINNESDDRAALLNILFQGMKLLEHDYLGGKGSRGCGKVSFQVHELKEEYAKADFKSLLEAQI